jgi:hypothetical protein
VQTVHRGHLYGTRSFFAATCDPYQPYQHDGLLGCMRWWAHEGPTCTLDPKTVGSGTMFGRDASYETPPPPAFAKATADKQAPPPRGRGRKLEEGGTA